MDCNRCGYAVPGEARFCPQCGVSMDGMPEPPRNAGAEDRLIEEMRDIYRQQQEQEQRERDLRSAQEQAFYADQEYQRLKKRRTSCLVAGMLIACIAFAAFPPGMRSDIATLAANPMVVIFVGMSFFAPFGFMPVKDFIARHGAVIVLAWVLLVSLFVLVFVFSMLAGLPYLLYLQSRIKTAKQDAEELEGRAQALAASHAQYR